LKSEEESVFPRIFFKGGDMAQLYEPKNVEIRYAADGRLTTAIEEWQRWLATERRCSGHTAAAYGRDLAFFLRFVQDYTVFRRIAKNGSHRFPRLSGRPNARGNRPDVFGAQYVHAAQFL